MVPQWKSSGIDTARAHNFGVCISIDFVKKKEVAALYRFHPLLFTMYSFTRVYLFTLFTTQVNVPFLFTPRLLL